MINRLSAHIISYICYDVDRHCREELRRSIIVSERDYVSNLAAGLRRPLHPFATCNILHAQTLPQTLETTFGCDAIIVLRKNDVAKIGMFEAKWPRFFTNRTYQWDSQNTAGFSRFSSQLLRQQSWMHTGIEFWEMFFNESSYGSNKPFDTFGSSCLRHHDAINYYNTHKVAHGTLWDNTDLLAFLPDAISFKRIVYNILICNFGKLFEIRDNEIYITSRSGNISIPVLGTSEIVDGYDSTIQAFMLETGLRTYISINLPGDVEA